MVSSSSSYEAPYRLLPITSDSLTSQILHSKNLEPSTNSKAAQLRTLLFKTWHIGLPTKVGREEFSRLKRRTITTFRDPLGLSKGYIRSPSPTPSESANLVHHDQNSLARKMPSEDPDCGTDTAGNVETEWSEDFALDWAHILARSLSHAGQGGNKPNNGFNLSFGSDLNSSGSNSTGGSEVSTGSQALETARSGRSN